MRAGSGRRSRTSTGWDTSHTATPATWACTSCRRAGRRLRTPLSRRRRKRRTRFEATRRTSARTPWTRSSISSFTSEQATRHLIWERLPNAQLSAEAKRFVGFRRLLYTDRYVEKDGKLIKHGERN